MELDPSVYTVAWIAPLEIEAKAALYMLDNRHEGKFSWSYGYDYLFHAGDINGHNVIIATLPSGQKYGTGSAAALASQIKSFFTNIKFGLLVGIAAGLPNLSSQNASLRRDIRLGDVLVGLPEGESAGLIAYDLGKETKDGFHLLHGGHALAKTEAIVRSAIGSIKIEAPYDAAKFLPFFESIKDKEHAYGTFADPGQDQDKLYGVDENGNEYVVLRDPRPVARRVRAWYGPIGSGEKLMKNAHKRNELRDRYKVIGLEMEAAGTMDVIPVGVIRGVCDYGDEHKNDEWQPYAAAMAAAYAKAILYQILPRKCKPDEPDEPEPSSTVPFERDRMFIGREDIIAAIENAFQDNDEQSGVHRRAAITGFGGVGKSQIAIEYTYRVRDLVPTTWVFWIYAATATRFDESYRKIANVAKIPGWNDPKLDITQKVYGWLSDKKSGRWLMVLDNADDSDVFFKRPESGQSPPLVDWLPHVSHGSILITSRDKTTAHNLVGSSGEVIPVEPMSSHYSMKLLWTRVKATPSQALEDEAERLVEALEGIPLAITQAGAYIAHRSPRITISTYLKLFQESESNQEHLLNYAGAHDLRQDHSIRRPVITTWQISFDQIRRISLPATDLLGMMSIYNRQGIPQELLGHGMNPLIFEDAVAPLLSFSLVRAEIGGRSFDLHRLIQLSIRHWLKKQGEDCFRKFVKQGISVMELVFPNTTDENPETRALCQMLYPHVKDVMFFAEEMNEHLWSTDVYSRFDGLTFAHRCSNYLSYVGKLDDAQAIARHHIRINENTLGSEHLHTLCTLTFLVMLLDRPLDHPEAEAVCQRAVIGYEKALGDNHPSTVHALASLKELQGKYEEAEAIYRRALPECEELLGANHPYIVSALNFLGRVLHRQGKPKEAEDAYRRALAIDINIGDRLRSELMISLSTVLINQGRYEEAGTMLIKVLDGKEEIARAGDHTFVKAVELLCLLLTCQRNYDEAEGLIGQTIAIRRGVLGPEHQAIISSTGNLFILLMLRKKYKQAVVLYPEALPLLIEWFKSTDPFFLKFAREVVVMLIDEEKYDEAQDLLRRIVDKDIELLGAQNQYTLRDIDWLGRLASGADNLEAGFLYRQAINGDGYLLRNEEPDTPSSGKDLLEARRKHENLLFSSRNLVIVSLVAILLLYCNPSAWA